MEALIGEIGTFIRDNQVWAGPLIALFCFGESLAIVGLLIPGTALMMVLGTLIGGGVIHPVPVIVGAILGSILGDMVSYYVGRRIGSRVMYAWPLNKIRAIVATARLLFSKYAFAAVFFGRFIGPLRSTVPLIAGMRGMRQSRFQVANVASAVIWAPAMLAPGYLASLGAEWLGATSATGMVILTAVLLGASIIFATVIVRMMSKTSNERRRLREARNSAS
jgi:membrane protein DedA with SNARE-associated domain